MILTPVTIFQDKVVAAAPAGLTPLIDDVGQSAVVAIGTRKLRAAYTGDCAQVTKDGVTFKDIGFDSDGNIDIVEILNFASTGIGTYSDVKVRTWYDQSGNGYDMQNTTLSSMPWVFKDGILLYDNGAGVRVTFSSPPLNYPSDPRGSSFLDSPTVTANYTPEFYFGAEVLAYQSNGLMMAEINNGYIIGTYNTGAASNKKIAVRGSAGGAPQRLGVEQLNFFLDHGTGDPFVGALFHNRNGGTNASKANFESYLGNLTQNLTDWTLPAGDYNASTFDNFTIFRFPASPTLNQAMTYTEFVYWDVSSGLSTAERQTAVDNGKAYMLTATLSDPKTIDTYDGSTAAYSIRQLSQKWNLCMQIRRDSDGTTAEIGFDANGDLDEAAISSFCSGTTGRVSIWYDQSNNGNHMIQNTVNNMPIIYQSGAIEQFNSKPTLRFAASANYGTIKRMNTLNYSNTGTETDIFAVAGTNQTANSNPHKYGRLVVLRNTAQGNDYDTTDQYIGFFGIPAPFNNQFAIGNNNNFAASQAYTVDQQYIYNYGRNGTSGWLYVDDGTVNSSTIAAGNFAVNSLQLGYDKTAGSDSALNGYVQEVIVYNIDNSADRTNIRDDINAYFSTY